MHETINDTEGDHAECIVGLFAVFYVDDGYIASCNAEFLQEALNILVETFKCIGLATKTQAIICTSGRIGVQLPTDSYNHMREKLSLLPALLVRAVPFQTGSSVDKPEGTSS